jgi:hypothetical protein
MNVDRDKKDRNNGATSDQVVEQLVKWIGLGLLTVGAFWGLKKLYVYLRDNVDWNDFASKLFQFIENQTSIRELHPNLDRAERQLSAGDECGAAFLICATLEKSLSILATSPGMTYNGDEQPKGMIQLATFLNQRDKIDELEKSRIEDITLSIRNPLFHGEFHAYDWTQIPSTLQWVREFINYHLV